MTINNLKLDELLKSENIDQSIKVRIHPGLYLGILLLLGFYVFKITDFFIQIESTNKMLFTLGELVVFSCGFILTYVFVLDLVNTELVMTSKRIIYKNGILRKIISIPYGKIQDIYLKPKNLFIMGKFFDVFIICMENSDFINSYQFHLDKLSKMDLFALEAKITKINEHFKQDVGGKVENIKIESNKYIVIDCVAIVFLVISLILLIF
ncbi:MAG: hypothetical protein MJB14_07665 [Spirochaetes bacterium]|nr:hypothetical protein [Spirochaetota bacterium]